MVQASLTDMFTPEANAGIRIFTGGRDSVDIADMSSDERDAILYCFDSNVKKIENISPKLAASLRPQRDAVVKWAQVAKGTFPETKNYSYPGQAGGLAVDFLNPYLFKYCLTPNQTAGGYAYTSYSSSSSSQTCSTRTPRSRFSRCSTRLSKRVSRSTSTRHPA